MRKALLLLICLPALAACRGPKGSPDGTVKSFWAAAAAKDGEGMASTFTAKGRAKIGTSESALNSLAAQFEGWTDIDVQIGETIIDVGGQTATVHFTCVGESIVSYKVVKFDCSDVVSLEKEEDGKWHIVPPSAHKLRPL